MTDSESYLRDLEAAAAAVGAIPDDYAMLRSLLAALPDGTAPDLRGGRTGVTAQAAGTGGLSAAGLTIQSATPIGSESGISQGIDQAPTLGLRNFFADARLTSGDGGSISLNDALSHQVTKDWSAIATFGATGASAQVFRTQKETEPVGNPLSTSTMDLEFFNWTAAGSGTIKAKSTLGNPGFDTTVLPFTVFSVTIYKNNQLNQLFSNCSVATVILKIRNAADNADLAVSTPLDFLNMGLGKYVRMWVALASATWDSANVIAQVELDVTTIGTGAGSAQIHVDVGNPQFELTATQVPTLFIPEPSHSEVVAFRPSQGFPPALTLNKFTDSGTNPRFAIDLADADEGSLEWGSGSATADARIRRTGTKILTLDNNAAGSGVLALLGQLRLSGIISPAQITANTDDYNPTDVHLNSVLRINSDAARNLTGINAGATGEMILLVNTGAFTITLVHDATSTAANRFFCPGSANFALLANQTTLIWYDITSARWRVGA
jgi:hypothetical protein